MGVLDHESIFTQKIKTRKFPDLRLHSYTAVHGIAVPHLNEIKDMYLFLTFQETS